MTVPFVSPINIYTAAGGEPSFAYSFPLDIPIAPADHEIVVKKKTGEVITTLVEGVDYTVTGAGNPLGGTIVLDTGVFPAGAVAADVFTLYRQIIVARPVDFQISGDFFAVNVNAQMDHLVKINQDTKLLIDQAITLPIGTGLSGLTFPLPIADGYIKWNASKTALEAATVVLVGSATGVDETDNTSSTKDKMVSNVLAFGWENTKQAVNGVQVGSAVNRLQVTNSATGNPVLIGVIGTDANIRLDLIAKGTGNILLQSNGGAALEVGNDGSVTVNRVTVRGSSTGAGSVNVEAVGGDTNIDLNLVPKGGGDVVVASGNLIVGGGVINIPTGTVVPYIGVTPPSGWVALDGGTIGSAASAATNRANADTATLYALYWDNMADAQAPVSTGRGANAAADFAANKTITISDLRGKAPFGTGGTGPATHGDNGGAETHTLIVSEIPSHSHARNDGGSVTAGSGGDTATDNNGTGQTGNQGGGGAHANMPPWVAFTYLAKL